MVIRRPYRLLCRIRNVSIQNKLLGEDELILEKAMEIAQAMEAAERNVKSLKGKVAAVNTVTKSTTTTKCYRCGRACHNQKDCKFRDAECHYCRKRGHIASASRTRKRTNPKHKQRSPKPTPPRKESREMQPRRTQSRDWGPFNAHYQWTIWLTY